VDAGLPEINDARQDRLRGRIEPLIEQWPDIEPDFDALVVAVSRARIAGRKALFIDEEARSVVECLVLRRRDYFQPATLPAAAIAARPIIAVLA